MRNDCNSMHTRMLFRRTKLDHWAWCAEQQAVLLLILWSVVAVCSVTSSPCIQGHSSVKVVPRVLFELDQAGVLQLLSQPSTAVDLLADVCAQEGFEGLVSRQADVSCVPFCLRSPSWAHT